MHPLVAYPDAEFTVGSYLKSSLPSLVVVDERPAALPAEFVRIERIGGARRSVVTDRPRVDVQCWSHSKESAWDLLVLVRAHILAMAGQRGTTRVYDVSEVGGPQWLPDNESSKPRYAFAVEFSTRGKEL